MIQKRQIKIILDVSMPLLLMFLMAYQVMENEIHEWIGTIMLVLFCLHNGLNFKWYKGLSKGKYSLLRTVWTGINILVIVSILLTGYSGIVMSRDVFAFLPFKGYIATARRIHLAASFWSFVLMGIHLGMHWNIVTAKFPGQKVSGQKTIVWFLRILGIGLAIFGAFVFGTSNIYINMFLKTDFAILDYGSGAVFILLKNVVMLAMWVCVGHFIAKGLQGLSKKRFHKSILEFVVVMAVIAVSVLCTPQNASDHVWQQNAQAQNNAEQEKQKMSDNIEQAMENPD